MTIEAIYKLTGVAVTGQHRLTISWDDGHVASVDFVRLIADRAVLAPCAILMRSQPSA